MKITVELTVSFISSTSHKTLKSLYLIAVLQVIEARFQAGTFYSWAGMSLYTNTKNSLPLPSPNNLIMTSQTCHDDEASDDEVSS